MACLYLWRKAFGTGASAKPVRNFASASQAQRLGIRMLTGSRIIEPSALRVAMTGRPSRANPKAATMAVFRHASRYAARLARSFSMHRRRSHEPRASHEQRVRHRQSPLSSLAPERVVFRSPGHPKGGSARASEAACDIMKSSAVRAAAGRLHGVCRAGFARHTLKFVPSSTREKKARPLDSAPCACTL